jgi:hypothetical protein
LVKLSYLAEHGHAAVAKLQVIWTEVYLSYSTNLCARETSYSTRFNYCSIESLRIAVYPAWFDQFNYSYSVLCM